MNLVSDMRVLRPLVVALCQLHRPILICGRGIASASSLGTIRLPVGLDVSDMPLRSQRSPDPKHKGLAPHAVATRGLSREVGASTRSRRTPTHVCLRPVMTDDDAFASLSEGRDRSRSVAHSTLILRRSIPAFSSITGGVARIYTPECYGRVRV